MSGNLLMRLALLFCSLLALAGCVALPDVYLVDRHTVMESEASGEWPEIEARLLERVRRGPEELSSESDETRRRRALEVLNGSFTSEPREL